MTVSSPVRTVKSSTFTLSPCIIGATGGSGTRAVARLVEAAGLFIGSHLNRAHDAIEMGRFSSRWINAHLRRRGWPRLRAHLERRMCVDLRERLISHRDDLLDDEPSAWGWKEPRSIYLLPFYDRCFERQMRFLHVVRDGRDMAFSRNQTQLRRHGRAMLGLRERFTARPLRAVKLWTRVNLRAAEYGQTMMGERYLRIRFEDLCQRPVATTQRIFDFFELDADARRLSREHIASPPTLGRWRQHEPDVVMPLQQAAAPALEKFGYPLL